MALETVAGGSSPDNRRSRPVCSRKSHHHANLSEPSSHPDRQLNGKKVGRTRKASEVSEKGNVGSHGFQLISVAGLDDDRESFIRTDVFCALSALLTDEFGGALTTPAIQLRARDKEHDFAFRRMCLVVCKQFGSSAATEFLKFFCQLTCDARCSSGIMVMQA